MNVEKGLENYEIDLLDLMFYCLEKWRVIVISILIFAIAMGGYKFRGTVKENQSKQQEILLSEAEKKKNEEILNIEADQQTEERDEEVDIQSVKSYEQAIKKSESILQRQEDYLERSIIMNLDPYHISTGTLSYYRWRGLHRHITCCLSGIYSRWKNSKGTEFFKF